MRYKERNQNLKYFILFSNTVWIRTTRTRYRSERRDCGPWIFYLKTVLGSIHIEISLACLSCIIAIGCCGLLWIASASIFSLPADKLKSSNWISSSVTQSAAKSTNFEAITTPKHMFVAVRIATNEFSATIWNSSRSSSTLEHSADEPNHLWFLKYC